MSRFVEFADNRGKKCWIKAECVVAVSDHGVSEQGESEVGVYAVGDGSPWTVCGTAAEVLAKLQGEPEKEPPKAADDITGWWVLGKHVIYVIGFRPDGRIAYQWDGGRATTHDDVTALDTWTRDPNRKGWGG